MQINDCFVIVRDRTHQCQVQQINKVMAVPAQHHSYHSLRWIKSLLGVFIT